MGRIRTLPPALVSKIAAGEVVERPASVVKELVENSLDAGATKVDVELERGGLSLIRVVDDGEGMEEEDALMAIEEYATSKVFTLEDLYAVTTLGFRGEALHAISSVSRFNLVTGLGDLATVVKVEGGVLKRVSKRPRIRGTTVEVRDLFFNLRARRRFMRSPSTETTHILRVMREYALAYPHVHFTLIEGGRVLMDAPAAPLAERMATLLGVDHHDLTAARVEEDGMVLEGLMASHTRRDTKAMFFFVNGRPVRDRFLVGMCTEALRGKVVRGEYPIAVFFFVLPPHDVDVNVHPTKREVRFRSPNKVVSLLRRWVGALNSEGERVFTASLPEGFAYADVPPPVGAVREEGLGLELPPWRYIGEYQGVFLLLELHEDLVLVDKHALHERMIYDALRGEWGRGGGVRLLLVPVEVSLEAEAHADTVEALRALGFRLQLKGDRVCEIKGVPLWFQGDVGPFLKLVLEGGWAEREVAEKAASLACREAMKAGEPLSAPQVEVLVDYLISKGLDLTCPHGRPVAVRFSKGEVERLFKRRV